MKIFLVLFILSSLPLLSEAQTKQQVVGNWQFDILHQKENGDTSGMKELSKNLEKLSFHFIEDGSYQANLLNEEDQGKWEYDSKEKKIVMRSNQGDGMDLIVMKATASSLSVKMQKMAFDLKRSETTTGNHPATTLAKPTVMVSSLEQMCKKWYLTKKEDPDKSKKENEMANALVKGTFFEYFEDGRFSVKVFDFIENGYWAFNDEQTGVIHETDQIRTYWNIHKITDSDLILLKGNTLITYHFSTKAP